MKNAQAVELLNILNSVQAEKGSHLELAVMRTQRNMKPWIESYNQRVVDIDEENCATYKNDKGVEVLLKDVLNRTIKRAGGDEEVIEELVPVYTKEGQKKRQKAKRELLEKDDANFEIYSTTDSAALNLYQKIVLEEVKFIVTAEEQAKKKPKK